jgi:hypothetical protein
MSSYPVSNAPDRKNAEEAGRYFRYMAEFVGFDQADADAIRQSSVIIEKYLPGIIGRFYTNLLQYPPTRKFFLKPDGSINQAYLELRMYHQANFWRRVGTGVYDDDFANFVDYVGRAHTSRGADPRVYIAERYVIGMVGFVQHAIIDAMMKELEGFDNDLQARAVKGWNKLCMVLLELLARAYGHEREAESFEQLYAVDSEAVHDLAVDSYEKSLGIRRRMDRQEVLVGKEDEIPEGERKIVQTDGLSIGVFHHKGNWYALRISPAPRGPVATGRLEGDNLICPGTLYLWRDQRAAADRPRCTPGDVPGSEAGRAGVCASSATRDGRDPGCPTCTREGRPGGERILPQRPATRADEAAEAERATCAGLQHRWCLLRHPRGMHPCGRPAE